MSKIEELLEAYRKALIGRVVLIPLVESAKDDIVSYVHRLEERLEEVMHRIDIIENNREPDTD